MNVIDLIVCLVLLLALWNGWRRGFILQICSLLTLVVAVWLAARFGGEAARLLRIETDYAEAVGFVLILVAAMLLFALLARVVRKVFHFAGFGLLDTLLGVAVAMLKNLLITSLIFAAIERINVDHALIPAETISASKCYRPVRNLSRLVLPFVSWATEQVYQAAEND